MHRGAGLSNAVSSKLEGLGSSDPCLSPEKHRGLVLDAGITMLRQRIVHRNLTHALYKPWLQSRMKIIMRVCRAWRGLSSREVVAVGRPTATKLERGAL